MTSFPCVQKSHNIVHFPPIKTENLTQTLYEMITPVYWAELCTPKTSFQFLISDTCDCDRK